MSNSDIQEAIVNQTIDELVLLINTWKTKNKKVSMVEDNSHELKILLVEGKTDMRFWKRILSDFIFINDVSDYVNSVCKLLGRRPNNKITVIEMCNCFASKNKIANCVVCNNWNVNGVIDRDFSGQQNDRAQNLHITDTHDLETMLIYSDSDIFQRLDIAKSYNLTISSQQVDTAKRLSLQLGFIRKALNELTKEEKQWILPYIQNLGNVDYELVNIDGNLDLNQFLAQINNSHFIRDQKNADQLNTIKKHMISTKALKQYVTSDGKWKNMISDDTLETWRIINGHDFLNFLKTLIPNAKKAYRSAYHADNAMEIDLIDAYDTTKLHKTRLYQSLHKNNFVENQNILEAQENVN